MGVWGGAGEAVVCAVFFPVRQKLWAAALTAASALLSIFSHFKPREENKGRELSCCRGNEDRGMQHRRGCPQ